MNTLTPAPLLGSRGRALAKALRRCSRKQWDSQGGCCYWCGEELKVSKDIFELGGQYHIDHYMPLALGGDNTPENIVISCIPCNRKKGDDHPEEFQKLALGATLE